MMPQAERYPYVTRNPALGAIGFLPFLPFTLTLGQCQAQVMGLLDCAATVNVLPFDVGQKLGADWDKQTVPIQLTGNLANEAAKGLLLSATVGKFPPVQLAFAWTKSSAVPVLLGEVDFFMEFDVFLSRSQMIFEIKPK
jgi:hypothetical protein